jgi:hypothetical protein
MSRAKYRINYHSKGVSEVFLNDKDKTGMKTKSIKTADSNIRQQHEVGFDLVFG